MPVSKRSFLTKKKKGINQYSREKRSKFIISFYYEVVYKPSIISGGNISGSVPFFCSIF